ncbi:MAG: cytochrome c oxidase subunit 3 family protein [Myxococcales bacterium]|nr:cytochrome c oxidase subunit 3 family protein [Myxococcales bacterium]
MENDRNDIPGEPGVWVFVLGDMLIFGLFFCVYSYYRALDPEAFREAQLALNQNFSAFNTLLLLISSWFVVLAMADLRERAGKLAPRLLLAAGSCGLGFVAVKAAEYTEIIHAGIGITTNDFFMYYFIFTGLHLVHVVIGIGVLALLFGLSRSEVSPRGLKLMESGSIYWHMVDLLWILLFPLLYLMP